MITTKNQKDFNTLSRMVEASIPGKYLSEATELTEGFCNAAYRLQLTDGQCVILKIAPSGRQGLMRHEDNLMQTEVEAMGIVAGHRGIPVAAVLAYDTSCSICDSPFFIMEMLQGESYYSVKDRLNEEQNRVINEEIGRLQKALYQIKGIKFGLVGEPHKWKDSWYDYFLMRMQEVFTDGEEKQVFLGINKKEVLGLLSQDKAYFDEIITPSLVHWDMWEGNIFVTEGHLSGVIDWERALWGDPLMDDRFRRHTRNQDFLHGFGLDELNAVQMRRISWYDIYLYLIMMIEGAYRNYEDDGQYQFAKQMLEASYHTLQKER